MKNNLLALTVMFGVLFLSACQDNESPSSSSSQLESTITPPSSSSVQQSAINETPSVSQDVSTPSLTVNKYQYNNIPSFPIPNISPQKITYFKAMLGETTVLLDAEQIDQVTDLLSKVEINDVPTKKDDDAELHHQISFYQNIDDEEPIYSLCFLVDSMYVQTNGISSDAYPTRNWDSKVWEDESKINVQFRMLLDSWAQPGFPPLP